MKHSAIRNFYWETGLADVSHQLNTWKRSGSGSRSGAIRGEYESPKIRKLSVVEFDGAARFNEECGERRDFSF